MKIRITENFIRVRISPKDAEELIHSNELNLSISTGHESALLWKLRLLTSHVPTIEFENQICLISIPYDSVLNWLRDQSEKIFFVVSDTQISLEKDYACDHQNASQENTFARPQ